MEPLRVPDRQLGAARADQQLREVEGGVGGAALGVCVCGGGGGDQL